MRSCVVTLLTVPFVVAFVACQSPSASDERSAPRTASSGSPTPSPTPLTAAEKRTADARYLIAQMKEFHPNLYHGISRHHFDNAARRFVDSASKLTKHEFLVEVMRMVALPTLSGRDGHSGLFPMHGGIPAHAFPLRLYDFSDGLHVVDAWRAYRDLVGAEIMSVDGVGLDKLRRLLYPLISRDNPTTIKARFPTTLITSEVLRGTGVTSALDATFEFILPDGSHRSQRVKPIPMEKYVARIGGHHHMWTLPRDAQVLYLSRMGDSTWVKYLADSRTVYAQYNEVVDPGALIAGMERHLRKDPARVVLDIRHNPGGNNQLYGSLVALLTRPKINQHGKLFVIAGRVTFSAAGNLAGEIDRETRAIFVGEPPGGSPNQFGDQTEIVLPHSGIHAYVPVYFVRAVPGDRRLSISPDIPAEPASSDFFQHRDPAMDAILQAR